ncbi:MAG: GntR family transcriptional regulator [Streptococcaceae bacterium]|nr:GntR family transcriptional regulator [Streptococcaceae bacterium]
MKKELYILEKIKNRILSEEFKIGSHLPSHSDLALEYKTSRVTISHIVHILTNQGIVVTRRGKGTFVVSKSFSQRRIDEPFQLNNIFSQKATTKVISFNIREIEEFEAAKLHAPNGSPVYDIIRLRLVDDKPAWLEYTVMPTEVIPTIEPSILLESIYAYITGELSLALGNSDNLIRAVKADNYDEKYLNIQKGEPMLEHEKIAYLKDGRAFEFSQSRHPYNELELTFSSKL